MKKKVQSSTYEVPVAAELWEAMKENDPEEQIVFTSVVGWGKRGALCKWLRSDKPLRRELRDLIADVLEGKYKPARNRPTSPANSILHSSRCRQLRREQREIADGLKENKIKSPMEAAKEILCTKYGCTESQLDRALELRPMLKAKPKP